MEETNNVPKSVEVMRKISSKEFSNYFYKNIHPKVVGYERWRPAIYVLDTILTVIAVILMVSRLFEIKNMDVMMVLVTILIVGLILKIVTPSMKKLQQQMKYETLPMLLNFIGSDFVVRDYGVNKTSGNPYADRLKDVFTFRLHDENADFKNSEEKEYEHTRLFDYFNRCKIDDYITGKYNSLPILFRDINLKRESGSGKNRTVIQIFKGLLVKFPMNKKFNGDIIVKRDVNVLINLGDSQNRVHLEDPVFEKYFDVYADDQVEARYILTTGFMNRLVSIASKNRNCSVSCSFIDGYMYLALDGKDWFDIAPNKSFSDIGNWQRVLVDFIDVFRIIDELKVEQNIGM